MARARRVALRCASEDLSSGWDVPSDLMKVKQLRELAQLRVDGEADDADLARHLRQMPPLAALRHPLITSFDEQFAGADDAGMLRESISSVRDRQWLKQRASRWRGAATMITDNEGAEVAWLGAAGYRRDGSPDDFYAGFTADCGDGSDRFLPDPADIALWSVDSKIARRDAWQLQVHLTAAALLCSALEEEASKSVVLQTPAGIDFLTMSMLVLVTDVKGVATVELIVELTPIGREHANLVASATRVVRSSIQSPDESWVCAPLVGEAMSYWTVLSDESVASARATVDVGQIDAGARPGDVRLGTFAHYARRDGLTVATVIGEAVHALCGHWFVPSRDPDTRPVCGTCGDRYARLSG